MLISRPNDKRRVHGITSVILSFYVCHLQTIYSNPMNIPTFHMRNWGRGIWYAELAWTCTVRNRVGIQT
jgi:hypothetical protein